MLDFSMLIRSPENFVKERISRKKDGTESKSPAKNVESSAYWDIQMPACLQPLCPRSPRSS